MTRNAYLLFFISTTQLQATENKWSIFYAVSCHRKAHIGEFAISIIALHNFNEKKLACGAFIYFKVIGVILLSVRNTQIACVFIDIIFISH